jgi:protein-tyrosine phosphatase
MSEPRVRLCFVCLGNICRSPTAEGVMRRLLADAGLDAHVHVESAGTGDWHVGEPADRRSIAHAARRGVVLDRRAQHLTVAHFVRFDLFLVADQSNLEAARRLAPSPADREKVVLLRSFDPNSPRAAEVPDPYYGGPEGFEEVLELCESACDGLLAHLRAAHGL